MLHCLAELRRDGPPLDPEAAHHDPWLHLCLVLWVLLDVFHVIVIVVNYPGHLARSNSGLVHVRVRQSGAGPLLDGRELHL